MSEGSESRSEADVVQADEALSEAEALFTSGDLRAARKAVLAAQKLGTVESARIDQLLGLLAARERLAGPTAAFEDARERQDWIAAREHARRGAALADGEVADTFRTAVGQCTARIRAEWRIGEAELDVAAEDALGDWTGELDSQESPPRVLADGGSTLVLVSTEERWVFLREVDLTSRRLRRVACCAHPSRLGGIRSSRSTGI